MKRISAVILLMLALLLSFSACGEKAANDQGNMITIQQWLDTKGGSKNDTLTVTVKTIENPVWAVIEDPSGASVHLFGVMIDGEHKTFEEAGIAEGDIIVISSGIYNKFEGTIEIKEATLIEKK